MILQSYGILGWRTENILWNTNWLWLRYGFLSKRIKFIFGTSADVFVYF